MPDHIVQACCRGLIVVAGNDGGVILSTGAGMQGAKPENFRAMIETTKEYGVNA